MSRGDETDPRLHRMVRPVRPVRLRAAIAVIALLPGLAHAALTAEVLRKTAEVSAARLGVCQMAFATVAAGAVSQVGSASGCKGRPPPRPDAIFQAASLGKPVFAYAVLKLAARGGFDLDAPLAGYLPSGYRHRQNPFETDRPPVFETVDAPELAQVTARMVLAHTSGLPNWSSGRLSFSFPPGTAWQYSGEGYMLLQRVVEAVSGQGLDAFMRTEIFEPLGMSSSSFLAPVADSATRLVGGTSAAGRPSSFGFPEPIAAGSLHTTAADYARFLAALIADGRAVGETTRHPVPVDAALKLDWGLGWGIEHGAAGPNLWQWGNNPGYRAFAMVSPGTGNAIVVLTNSERGLGVARSLVEAELAGEHPAFSFRMVR